MPCGTHSFVSGSIRLCPDRFIMPHPLLFFNNTKQFRVKYFEAPSSIVAEGIIVVMDKLLDKASINCLWRHVDNKSLDARGPVRGPSIWPLCDSINS